MKPVCLRTNLTQNQDLETKAYQSLFLYLPWRNEAEIIKPFSSATEALRQKEPLLQIKSPHLINFANDLQKLIQQLQLLDSLYNITNTIAPGTSHSDDTSSSDIDTEFSAVDVSSAAPTCNIDPDLAENIHDTSLPHKTMTNEEFHDALHSLSVDQLHALETIQQHIRPQILQHPSAKPLHLFITGGAGTGKSYLTKLIYEYINRSSNKPTSTVLLLVTHWISCFKYS